jgi:hypothetical protein
MAYFQVDMPLGLGVRLLLHIDRYDHGHTLTFQLEITKYTPTTPSVVDRKSKDLPSGTHGKVPSTHHPRVLDESRIGGMSSTSTSLLFWLGF